MCNANEFVRREDVLKLVESKLADDCLCFNGKYMVNAYDLIDGISSMPSLLDIENSMSKARAQVNNMISESVGDILEEVSMTVIKDGGME